jgi:hypothetical protein
MGEIRNPYNVAKDHMDNLGFAGGKQLINKI